MKDRMSIDERATKIADFIWGMSEFITAEDMPQDLPQPKTQVTEVHLAVIKALCEELVILKYGYKAVEIEVRGVSQEAGNE